MTPPHTLLDMSRRNGGIYNLEFPNIIWSVDAFSFNQPSVNECISWQEYSAEIMSILDTIL